MCFKILIMILILLTQTTHRLVWMFYPSQDCVTCHKVPSIKLNDTTIVVGGFHWDGNYRRPFIIAFDTFFQTKFYRAYTWFPITNLTNFAITDIVKLSDSEFVAVGGASNLLSNNSYGQVVKFKFNGQIDWSVYINNINLLTGVDFDGNYIITTGMQGNRNGNAQRLIKINVNGNIIFHKSYFNGARSSMDLAYDRFTKSYVLLGRQNNHVIKLDTLGNVIWSYTYPSNVKEQPQSIIVDGDGNYVFVGHLGDDAGPADIQLVKLNPNGTIIYQKRYTSNLGNSDERAYNISLDFDGNYLIAGFVRLSINSSMPFAMKVNKNNGDLIWVRAWILAPSGYSSNKGMGILSVNPNVYLLSGYIGSGADASSGMFFLFFRDTVPNCIKDITNNFITYNLNYTPQTLNLSVSNIPSNALNFSLNPYSPPLIENDVGGSCATPVDIQEHFEDCYISITKDGLFLNIISKEKQDIRISIFKLNGSIIYKKNFKQLLGSVNEKIKLKDGVYILKVSYKNKEKIKIIFVQ